MSHQPVLRGGAYKGAPFVARLPVPGPGGSCRCSRRAPRHAPSANCIPSPTVSGTGRLARGHRSEFPDRATLMATFVVAAVLTVGGARCCAFDTRRETHRPLAAGAGPSSRCSSIRGWARLVNPRSTASSRRLTSDTSTGSSISNRRSTSHAHCLGCKRHPDPGRLCLLAVVHDRRGIAGGRRRGASFSSTCRCCWPRWRSAPGSRGSWRFARLMHRR